MAGGLIQLMAYGSQNQYLMGNPQITFFRMVYRRHTNFSMESIKQYFSNNSIITMDSITKLTCKIDRHGDLINNIYLAMTLPAIYSDSNKAFKWIKNIGLNIIKEIRYVYQKKVDANREDLISILITTLIMIEVCLAIFRR